MAQNEKYFIREEVKSAIFNAIGYVYRAKGEYENALINYRKAYELNPDKRIAQNIQKAESNLFLSKFGKDELPNPKKNFKENWKKEDYVVPEHLQNERNFDVCGFCGTCQDHSEKEKMKVCA